MIRRLAAACVTLGLLAPPAHAQDPISYRTTSVDGLSIFYREAGAAHLPTIVLLHGFPTSSHMFRDVIASLAGRFHVVAPDYPGFGYSDAPDPAKFVYTFDNLAQVMDRALSQIGASRYILYMQDYGAPIGLRIATSHPERVIGLVIQNGNAYREGLSELASQTIHALGTSRTPAGEATVRHLISEAGIREQYLTGAHDPTRISPDTWTFDAARMARAHMDEIQVRLFSDYISNHARYDAWHDYLRRNRPKTLVLWGKNDPFFVAAGAMAYRRDLPDAEVQLLDGGHFALEEHPALIVHEIIRVFAPPSSRVQPQG
jgi:pimeloyl-ACP methyl ester carboxylesterase